MRKPIPLYDETAVVACTITDAEVPARVELVARLRAAMTTVERTDAGLLLQFPDTDATRADLSQLVVDEKRCCQFWGFAVSAQPDRVTLRWDGPPEVSAVLDALYAYFIGAAPSLSLRGLL